jgi:glyceraldehyde 3-phosphate dehydrogenase
MAIKIGINGYGRIGRNIVRAIFESGQENKFDIVGINDLGDPQINAHLTQYDTAHGRFPGEVVIDGNDLVVNGDRLRVLAEPDPGKLPWGELGAEIVLECTGRFRSMEDASNHISAGAGKVIISAPGKGVDATVVYGVYDHNLQDSDKVI